MARRTYGLRKDAKKGGIPEGEGKTNERKMNFKLGYKTERGDGYKIENSRNYFGIKGKRKEVYIKK